MARKKKSTEESQSPSSEQKKLMRQEKLSDEARKDRAMKLAAVRTKRDEVDRKYKSIQKEYRGELAKLDRESAKLQQEAFTGIEEVDAQDSLDLE